MIVSDPRLVEIFALDNAEQTLFRSYSDLMSEAGCWAAYLNHMLTFCIGSYEGACGALQWSLNVCEKPISFKGRKIFHRIARKADIFQKNISSPPSWLQISLEPHIYYKDTINEYADYRFSVKSNNETIPTIAILFFDQFFQNYS